MTVPLPPDELRTKIIETLAHTANGCLSELGLTPEMPQRLQALTEQNRLLYNDNVKLHTMLRHALDKIEHIRVASPDAQTQRMLDLERRLSVAQSERDNLLKALEAKTGVDKEAAYQALQAENRRLHARLERHLLRNPPKALIDVPKPQFDMDTSADGQIQHPPTGKSSVDQFSIDTSASGQTSTENTTVSQPTMNTSVQAEDGEDDEEEEEEFGPDGLRLISCCLEQLFEDTEQGRVCRLCRFVVATFPNLFSEQQKGCVTNAI